MPDESEVIQADVYVDLLLPGNARVRGKPVPYPVARQILAQLAVFDQTGDYDTALVPALEAFTKATGITDDQVMAVCPDCSLGELTSAMLHFFFRRRPPATTGAAKPTTASPAPGA